MDKEINIKGYRDFLARVFNEKINLIEKNIKKEHILKINSIINALDDRDSSVISYKFGINGLKKIKASTIARITINTRNGLVGVRESSLCGIIYRCMTDIRRTKDIKDLKFLVIKDTDLGQRRPQRITKILTGNNGYRYFLSHMINCKVENIVESRDIIKEVDGIISILKNTYTTVLFHYYGLGTERKTKKQIAKLLYNADTKKLGVSVYFVRARLFAAINKVRGYKNMERLLKYTIDPSSTWVADKKENA